MKELIELAITLSEQSEVEAYKQIDGIKDEKVRLQLKNKLAQTLQGVKKGDITVGQIGDIAKEIKALYVNSNEPEKL